MVRGIYTSALGMTTQMNRMDIISNNLANANTTGFKKDVVSTSSFPDEMARILNDKNENQIFVNTRKVGNLNLGVYIDSIHTDFSQGSLEKTDNSLDIAIAGNGFIAVQADGKEKYTRDGALTLNNEGNLMTKDGFIVKGTVADTINIPSGNINIDNRGNIFVEDEYIDTIRMVSFADDTYLKKVGDNLLETRQGSTPAEFTGSVMQGFVERSNVNAVKEMVEMINVSRNYEANQKMIQHQDSTLSRAVAELAKK